MKKLVLILLLCAHVLVAAPKQKKPPPWWLRLLRFAGVTATPATQRGEHPEVLRGDVWIRKIGGSSAIRLLVGNYSSPIFGCGAKKVYAISNGALYEVNAAGGAPSLVLRNAEIAKLVGVDPHACDDVLVVTHSHKPGVLSLATHDFAEFIIDENEDGAYVRYLESDERHYGERSVNTEPNFTDKVSNVILKYDEGQKFQTLTNCKAGCVQPNLSHDDEWVVYVRLR